VTLDARAGPPVRLPKIGRCHRSPGRGSSGEGRIALAANPDAAICARAASVRQRHPYGDEAKFLGSLPLSLLGAQDLQETLERWGIRYFQIWRRCLAGYRRTLAPKDCGFANWPAGNGAQTVPLEEPLRFEDEIEWSIGGSSGASRIPAVAL